jgi:Tol biopolymer transport system component
MLVCLVAREARGQAILARQGDLYLRERNGQEQRLTASGRDSDASLSADGKTVVFVRAIRVHPDASGLGTVVEQSEVACIDLADQRHEVQILLGTPVDARGLHFQWFSSPRFSPDGSVVYFLVPDYSTVSPGLFLLERSNGHVRFLAQALEFWEVAFGPYRGNLIVWQNPMLIGGGRYDLFSMLSPSGEQVGVVGFNEGQVNAFLADQVSAAAPR